MLQIKSISSSSTSLLNRKFLALSLFLLVFGDSLKSIGAGAFSNARNLTTVTLGENVENIATCAFESCTRLTSFITTSTIEIINEAVFAEDELLEVVQINGMKYIKDAAFYNCLALKEINLTNAI